MWHDQETTDDLLNFGVLAETAAGLIRDSDGQPISIGVSGNWGAGKSSLVKMIGTSLRNGDGASEKFVFIEFNAWLYQGYDDARLALLQTVADKLLEEAEKREVGVDKVKSFISRINWFRVGKMAAPIISGAVLGGGIGGPVGALVGAVGGIFKNGATPSQEDLDKLKDAYDGVQPQLAGLLSDREIKSLPKEIEGLRQSFKEILVDLDITLVVLVDDLDRCLPHTAISTLEAMRLLLFLPRTAFIIAADEGMIRNAVRSHFQTTDLSDELVTSYFDKLIQIPMRVPRLGVSEVKAYLVLLLADLAKRRGDISPELYSSAKQNMLTALSNSWLGGLSKKNIEDAFGEGATSLSREIELADQLAPLMATADRIKGNPRLIKRFMNDLMIRSSIAQAHGMTLPFDLLIKTQLFERSASSSAFEYFAKQVSESEDGKPVFICELEKTFAEGDEYSAPDTSWNNSFVESWIKMSPQLSGVDLRPFLHLSKDRTLILAGYDELSREAQEILEIIIENKGQRLEKVITTVLQALGDSEAERLFTRLSNKARRDQFDLPSLVRALYIPHVYPALGNKYVSLLSEIPSAQRKAPIVPLLKDREWAQALLLEWRDDSSSPKPVQNAISREMK